MIINVTDMPRVQIPLLLSNNTHYVIYVNEKFSLIRMGRKDVRARN